MDKYDDVIIADLEAQVASLEAELAEARRERTFDKAEVSRLNGMFAEVQAANAALAAALRAVEITAMRLRSDANVAKDLGYEGGDEAATADELMAIIEAALSPDAGAGWLSPEVAGPLLAEAPLTYEFDNEWGWVKPNGKGPLVLCAYCDVEVEWLDENDPANHKSDCVWARAALDSLNVVK